LHRTVPLCGACHRQIHRTLTEKELEREYNTVEALLSHPDILRFVGWIEHKPHGVKLFAGVLTPTNRTLQQGRTPKC
jgi:hypothetical protein